MQSAPGLDVDAWRDEGGWCGAPVRRGDGHDDMMPGGGTRMATITRTIEVPVPVDDAFDFVADFSTTET